MRPITRREFIRQSAMAAMAGLALSAAGLPKAAWAAPDNDTILIPVMLAGGPDFRYFLPPAYDETPGTYGNEFWKARAQTYDLSPFDTNGLQNRWASFHHLNDNGVSFGIHPNCTWLRDKFLQGNVAIIGNVFASRNRDHAHSTLMLELGDLDAGANDSGKSGWGGRLAKACGKNVCSLTQSVMRG